MIFSRLNKQGYSALMDLIDRARTPDTGSREGTTAPLVPAVVRALMLLERLARQRQPMSASQLAAELALPRSSVHGLCSTLLHFGYLRRQGEGGFAVGASVMGLAEAFIADIDVAQEFAGLWQEAVIETEESVVLSVLNGADAVYVAVRNSPRPLGIAFNVGVRLPAYLSGSGKAMLAFMPTDTVTRLIGGAPLATLTGKGPASREELFDEFAQIRDRGFSVDDEGVRAGVLSFGAPVFDAGGRVIAGVAMCINKATLDAAALERHRAVLLDIADCLTRRLGGGRAHGVRPAIRST
jgi:DNA-binding IclR family transcriptional regulator